MGKHNNLVAYKKMTRNIDVLVAFWIFMPLIKIDTSDIYYKVALNLLIL